MSSLTTFVVGDTHFKAKDVLQGVDFIERVVAKAKEANPTFIVILGDVLDTHEVVRVAPHKLASRLFEEMSLIAPTYVLIGNHDLINHSQFLTDEHIFNPMKKWDNLTIVDRPIVARFEDADGVERVFVMCPYVPPGRFVEALNTLVTCEGFMWDFADGIFAHQEFEGCQMGAIVSEVGDSWDQAYPPVISGHIHDAQTVGTNVFYTGSAIQHAFGESPNKRVWFMNWNPDESDESSIYLEQGFSVEKINLGMKAKKMQSMTVEELMSKDSSKSFIAAVKQYHLKVSLTGTSEEFKKFRRSRFSATLKDLGVKFSYKLIASEELDAEGLASATRKDVAYTEVLKEVVAKKDALVQDEYRSLFGGSAQQTLRPEEGKCILVFVDSSDEDLAESDIEGCSECGYDGDDCDCE